MNDDILEQRVPACVDSAVCLKRTDRAAHSFQLALVAGRSWEAGSRQAPYCAATVDKGPGRTYPSFIHARIRLSR